MMLGDFLRNLADDAAISSAMKVRRVTHHVDHA